MKKSVVFLQSSAKWKINITKYNGPVFLTTLISVPTNGSSAMYQFQLWLFQSSYWSYHFLPSSPVSHRLHDVYRVHLHGRNQGTPETRLHCELSQPQLGLCDACLPHTTDNHALTPHVLYSQVPLPFHLCLDYICSCYPLHLCHSHS